MGFQLQYYYNGFYPYFTIENKISDKEFRDFIGVLQELIDLDKPFVFIVDARQAKEFNFLTCGWEIVSWMRKNKPTIKKNLKGSGVVINSQVVTNIINWIFERQPPVSPNKVTTNVDEALDFINDIIPSHLKIKSINNLDTDTETEEEEEEEKDLDQIQI
jgi:hypothetical protein